TAASLAARGLRADIVASEFSSEGLLDSMPADMSGRVLLPRAADGTPALVEGLRARGAEVDELVLYETRAPSSPDAEALQMIRDGRIDVATFASSSAVRNLATLLGGDFARLNDGVVACIGPVTASAARELGLRVDIEPAPHTIPALVAALRAWYDLSPSVPLSVHREEDE
ncbi:MAG TPA: uroporphyrinogen-III synthase, partial [Dehalococcoidia bacterium]|nr:uroporphyrinogen-III synthase [Dehalococcoidia bacterium]